ncbi:MAG: C40 family peptidase, partial [Candidatus Kapabacteria bacterium]|nr:C40 family peptidase [Candidatus Kapabacteria bacterium]
FKTLWLSYIDPAGANEPSEKLTCGVAKSAVMDAVMDWLGTPYHFGGTSRNGIDCSAFVRAVFNQSANIVLPRTAQSQSDVGRAVARVSDLQFGDMVFFHTMSHAYVSHVGIYLGDNLFAHASSRYGVTISSLQSTYYGSRIIGARRLSVSDIESLTPKQEFVTDTR